MSTDRIEKRIELDAPVSRVWRAVSDYREFGEWFRVKLEGPFAPGKPAHGKLTYPGFESYPFEIVVKEIVPERRFSFTWHPYAVDPKVDYASEPSTLVTFELRPSGKGTLLTVTESGFDALPAGQRRLEAFRRNDEGWAQQMQNVADHVRNG